MSTSLSQGGTLEKHRILRVIVGDDSKLARGAGALSVVAMGAGGLRGGGLSPGGEHAGGPKCGGPKLGLPAIGVP